MRLIKHETINNQNNQNKQQNYMDKLEKVFDISHAIAQQLIKKEDWQFPMLQDESRTDSIGLVGKKLAEQKK